MSEELHSVTVYCASSGELDDHFGTAARRLGEGIAALGLTMVYGGGSIGLMGECARACRAAGGRVLGIITGKLDALEHGWRGCDELDVVDSMQERRRRMMDLGDGFVVLPGGLGTYEEFFEVIVGRQLGDHGKPIVIVNHDGYYDPLIALIDHGIEHKFIRPAIREALVVVNDVTDALAALRSHRARRHDPAEFLFLPAAELSLAG
ncbi:MAG: TIGR00730 family Rossman fold protein [Mycobacterium sp.]|nr:TIGR00730 family Rossman fold protein [Mycobacterium sp.]